MAGYSAVLAVLLFTLIFGNNFLFLILANCVRDESCREKLAPISPKGLKFVGQTGFCVHIWRFGNKLIQAHFLSLLLTGKF